MWKKNDSTPRFVVDTPSVQWLQSDWSDSFLCLPAYWRAVIGTIYALSTNIFTCYLTYIWQSSISRTCPMSKKWRTCRWWLLRQTCSGWLIHPVPAQVPMASRRKHRMWLAEPWWTPTPHQSFQSFWPVRNRAYRVKPGAKKNAQLFTPLIKKNG